MLRIQAHRWNRRVRFLNWHFERDIWKSRISYLEENLIRRFSSLDTKMTAYCIWIPITCAHAFLSKTYTLITTFPRTTPLKSKAVPSDPWIRHWSLGFCVPLIWTLNPFASPLTLFAKAILRFLPLKTRSRTIMSLEWTSYPMMK